VRLKVPSRFPQSRTALPAYTLAMGGGIIGAGEHENVRNATGRFLSIAQKFYEHADKTTSFPTPESGQVIFYFITFDGVRSYVALEDDLGNDKDNLSNLFFSAHDVISEIRNNSER
jgi:hypothetical protein